MTQSQTDLARHVQTSSNDELAALIISHCELPAQTTKSLLTSHRELCCERAQRHREMDPDAEWRAHLERVSLLQLGVPSVYLYPEDGEDGKNN